MWQQNSANGFLLLLLLFVHTATPSEIFVGVNVNETWKELTQRRNRTYLATLQRVQHYRQCMPMNCTGHQIFNQYLESANSLFPLSFMALVTSELNKGAIISGMWGLTHAEYLVLSLGEERICYLGNFSLGEVEINKTGRKRCKWAKV